MFCVPNSNILFPICVVFSILSVREIHGGCNLSLKNDFASPAPVFLRNGDFLAPDAKSGQVKLQRAETLAVACPGADKYITINNHSTEQATINVKCVRNATFQAPKSSWVGALNEVSCNQWPRFTTEEIGTCLARHKMYRVGYEVAGSFHTLYSACFDAQLLTTLFVRELLSPSKKYAQVSKRPDFIEGELFHNKKMGTLYKVNHQRCVFDKLLGNGMGEKYVTKVQYLSRGHLAPRGDFSLVAEQRASFHYVNSAPQWQRGNAGDWAALEEALRRRINSHGAPVTVYTGTHGVSTLPDVRGVDTQLYLDVDENNNGIVPVPLYFYKIVHDEEQQTAVVFISINSSYYNTTTIKQLAFCYDICDQNPQFKWLKWRPRDGTHSFCCTYEEFAEKIHDIPRLNVQELFY